MRKIKAGVIGVGSVGYHHARIYSTLPDVELVGVCDINHERGVNIAKELGCKFFENCTELASMVDCVSIAVPADKHFEIFKAISSYNCHILMEKPFAANTEEAQEMIKIAETKNTILMVGHVERYNPVIEFLKTKLTHPLFIEAIRLSRYPSPSPGSKRARGTEVSVVLDLMIHDLDVILAIVRSDICEIHAVGVPVLSDSEDIANARIKFNNGCIANITASRISSEPMRKIRIFQEDSYLSLDYNLQIGKIYRKSLDGIKVEDVPVKSAEPLRLELEDFINCIRNRLNPRITCFDAFEALKLASKILKALKENPS